MIFSGGLIYILSTIIPRVFRPTFLEVFNLNNFQTASLLSIYGICCLFSYLFGGPLADRLIGVALLLTALGGLVLASYPTYLVLKILYGYWGFNTLLLFWCAMIKASRIWGGAIHQGKAFGFLEGGRGLVVSLMGTPGVFILLYFPLKKNICKLL